MLFPKQKYKYSWTEPLVKEEWAGVWLQERIIVEQLLKKQHLKGIRVLNFVTELDAAEELSLVKMLELESHIQADIPSLLFALQVEMKLLGRLIEVIPP